MKLLAYLFLHGPQSGAEEAAAAAAAQLPPEPPAGESGACTVAVRFPDGSRRSRRFPGGAPLRALRAFCAAHSPEAAAGRPFALSESFPPGACGGGIQLVLLVVYPYNASSQVSFLILRV